MNKALVITDFGRSFHNYRDGVDTQIRRIFEGVLEIGMETQDLNAVTLDVMRSYDCLLFFCAPTWGLKSTDQFLVDLVTYLSEGGRILLLHLISFGTTPEGAQIFGGAFRMHPPLRRFHFLPADSDDPVLKGVKDFSVDDEAHMMYTDPNVPKQMLLYCDLQNGREPAAGAVPHQDIYAGNGGIQLPLAWKYRFGRGKILYTCPGHNAASLEPDAYDRFLINSAKWLLSDDE